MTESSVNNLIHLFTTTSKHAYPALLDLVNYVDTIKKLPNKIDFDTINEVFKITLNFADTDEEIISVYTKWIRFVVRFCDNPFVIDVHSVLPERIRNANEKTLKLSKIIDDTWTKDVEIPSELYEEMLSSSTGTPEAELIKFLKNEDYEPVLTGINGREFNEVLEMLFCKYYYDGRTEKALEVLDLLPKTWRRYWNTHLCDTSSNETIDALLFLLEKDKEKINGKEVLMLQLELKALVNGVEGKLGEDGFIDEDIIRQISIELEGEYPNIDEDSEELVDIFTTRLYEKTVFAKGKAIYASLPDDLTRDDLICLNIELKKVFEFCEEQGIVKARNYLDKINKVLFEELKDVASGVALLEKMLKNNSHIKIAQYLEQLCYLLEPDSLEMGTLYELLARHVSTQRFSPKQFLMYSDVFKKSHHPHFKVLTSMLTTFQKDEVSVRGFAASLIEHMDIFKNEHQLFYLTCEPVFHTRLGIKSVQSFISTMVSSPLDGNVTNSITHLLIDYLNEQPYLDFKKDFPRTSINSKTVSAMQKILDSMVDRSMEDAEAEMELESKWQAVDKCREFLSSLTEKKITLSVLGEAIK